MHILHSSIAQWRQGVHILHSSKFHTNMLDMHTPVPHGDLGLLRLGPMKHKRCRNDQTAPKERGKGDERTEGILHRLFGVDLLGKAWPSERVIMGLRVCLNQFF